jgi:hypothetical protein
VRHAIATPYLLLINDATSPSVEDDDVQAECSMRNVNISIGTAGLPSGDSADRTRAPSESRSPAVGVRDRSAPRRAFEPAFLDTPGLVDLCGARRGGTSAERALVWNGMSRVSFESFLVRVELEVRRARLWVEQAAGPWVEV